MKLIINVDDFGLTKATNEAVFELAALGTISSVTVMVNMPFAFEIKSLVNQNNLGIGLHLNLTQGKPISPTHEVQSLIDDSGNFLPIDILKKRIRLNSVNKQHVLQEISAQYIKLAGLIGNKVSHIDSHQDIMKFSIINRALLDFAGKSNLHIGLRWYNKTYVTKSENQYNLINPSLLNISKFGLMRSVKETFLRQKKKAFTSTFKLPYGMLYPKDNRIRTLLKILPEIPSELFQDNILEIMCHPATKTDGLQETKMLEARVEEYEILKSYEFEEFVKRNKLISFSDL